MARSIDAIEIDRVSKRYGRHRALAPVEMMLEPGRLCALVGPNGAGKSTLMGVVSTLVRPTGGDVIYRYGGQTMPAGEELRRHIGILAHESFVYPQLSAEENLAFWARLYEVPQPAQRSAELLDQVGLDDRARRRSAGTYSRGMLQRLALARALLHRPSVLLLDEPFTGLDQTGSEALQAALAGAKADGCILLVITHDLEAIAEHADHVVVLRRGQKVHEIVRESGHGFEYRELQGIYREFSE